MKIFNIAFFFTFVIVSLTRGAEPKLSELFSLATATQFVFVNEVPVEDGFGYEETKEKGETKGALADALKMESDNHYSIEMNYPFIGILGRVMLLDREGVPICTMEVVNWDRTVVFRGVKKKNGKIVIDNRQAIINSEALSRWVYEQVRAKNPADFKRQQEMYAKSGNSIESLLFPKDGNGEQPGTGQPATRPVDEPEGGDKPQP